MEKIFTLSKLFGARLCWRVVPALVLGLIAFSNPADAQVFISEGFESATFPPPTPGAGWTRAIISGSYNWNRGTSSSSSTPSCVPHTGTGQAWYNCWSATSGQAAQLV